MTSLKAAVGTLERILSQGPSKADCVVAWRGIEVAVITNLPEVQRELRSRLTPFFNVLECQEVESPVDRSLTPRCHIIVRAGLGHASLPSSMSRPVLLRHSAELKRYCRTACIFQDKDRVFVYDIASEVSFGFVRDSGSLAVVGPYPEAIAKCCRRLIQDLVRLYAWRNGTGIIEASAVANADGALVIAGGSGAGKTTLLARLLTAGGLGFLANDEVMLEPSSDRVIATGAPIHVMVRLALAKQYDQLSDILRRITSSGEPKCSMHYRDFAQRFGVTIQPEAATKAIAFIAHGSTIRQIPPRAAAERLRATLQWDETWDTPWRSLTPGGSSPVPEGSGDRPLGEAFSDKVTGLVPAYHVGRDAGLPAIRWLLGLDQCQSSA